MLDGPVWTFLRRGLAAVLCAATLLSEGALAAEGKPRLLAIGDSILAWQAATGGDIPSVIGRTAAIDVVSRAVSGAPFSNATEVGRALGFEIRAQYEPGDWDVVLMNGGANDLNRQCGCGACGHVLNRLISPKLTGEIPDFVARVRADGPQVVWMGYYRGHGRTSFSGCRPWLVAMEARIAQLAERTEGLRFIDAEDVVDASDPRLYVGDRVHPSVEGARVIGEYLARAIQ